MQRDDAGEEHHGGDHEQEPGEAGVGVDREVPEHARDERAYEQPHDELPLQDRTGQPSRAGIRGDLVVERLPPTTRLCCRAARQRLRRHDPAAHSGTEERENALLERGQPGRLVGEPADECVRSAMLEVDDPARRKIEQRRGQGVRRRLEAVREEVDDGWWLWPEVEGLWSDPRPGGPPPHHQYASAASQTAEAAIAAARRSLSVRRDYSAPRRSHSRRAKYPQIAVAGKLTKSVHQYP